MVRLKQCFTVFRNIIWLAFIGPCLLLIPSEIFAETHVYNIGKLLPVPPQYGCPLKSLSCVASEGDIKFLPDVELSLPA